MKYWQGLGLLFGMTALISCNSDNPNSSDPENKVQTVSGQLNVPTYTSAKVWLDMNNDGEHHPDEPSVEVTPETGRYTLNNVPTAVANTSPLAAQIRLAPEQTQTLTAAPKSNEISALTTVIYENPNNYVGGQYLGNQVNNFFSCTPDKNQVVTFLPQHHQTCIQVLQDAIDALNQTLNTPEFDGMPIKTKLALAADTISQSQDNLSEEHQLRLIPENASIVGFDNFSPKSKQALAVNKAHIPTKAKLVEAKKKAPYEKSATLAAISLDGLTMFGSDGNDMSPYYKTLSFDTQTLAAKTERMRMQGSEFVVNPAPFKGEFYVVEGTQAKRMSGDYNVGMPESLVSSTEIPLVQEGYPSLELSMKFKAIDIHGLNMQAVLGHRSNVAVLDAPVVSDWIDMLPAEAEFGSLAKTYILQMENKKDMLFVEHDPDHCTDIDEICNIVSIYKNSDENSTPALSVKDIMSESPAAAPYDKGNFVLVEQVGQQKLLMQMTPDGKTHFYHEKYAEVATDSDAQSAPESSRKRPIQIRRTPVATGNWQRVYTNYGTEIEAHIPERVKLRKRPANCVRTYKKVSKKMVSGCKIRKGSVIRDNHMVFNRPATRDILSIMNVGALSERTMPMLDTLNSICRNGDSMKSSLSSNSEIKAKRRFIEFLIASMNCEVTGINEKTIADLFNTHDLMELDINRNPIRRISINGNNLATMTTFNPSDQIQEQLYILKNGSSLGFRPQNEDSSLSPFELSFINQEADIVAVKRFIQQITNNIAPATGEFNDDDLGTVDTKVMMLVPKSSN